MKTVLQIEFSPSLLAERAAVLERNGYRVISALGSADARTLEVLAPSIGVVVAHFREVLRGVPIVALLRSNDDPFTDADFNCRADNPPLWEGTVAQTLERTERLH